RPTERLAQLHPGHGTAIAARSGIDRRRPQRGASGGGGRSRGDGGNDDARTSLERTFDPAEIFGSLAAPLGRARVGRSSRPRSPGVTAVPVSSTSIAESVVTPQGTTADASAIRQRSLFRRRQAWTRATTELFDAAVVGAGINGATVYHELCPRGYRVLLLDGADFGGGTSQASGMMIWGGILYLAQFDVQVVRDFCLSRDRLIQAMPSWVKLDPNRYVFRSRHGRGPLVVGAGLFAYWLLG